MLNFVKALLIIIFGLKFQFYETLSGKRLAVKSNSPIQYT